MDGALSTIGFVADALRELGKLVCCCVWIQRNWAVFLFPRLRGKYGEAGMGASSEGNVVSEY